MRVRTAMRGRAPGEAVPEASLRIAEYQEQYMEGRGPRESILFTGFRSTGICPDHLSSEYILSFILLYS